MNASSSRRPEPGTGKPIECATCGKRLADKRSLRQHVAAAHPPVDVDVATTSTTEGGS